jgi:predicted RNA binding protein YcfA (HicA-like mRNA interferase family)
MAKHEDTLEQVRALNGNLAWKRVEALLKHLGATVYEGSGSTVAFVLNDRKLTVDRPHPGKECGKGLVKRVKMYSEELGHLGAPPERREKR